MFACFEVDRVLEAHDAANAGEDAQAEQGARANLGFSVDLNIPKEEDWQDGEEPVGDEEDGRVDVAQVGEDPEPCAGASGYRWVPRSPVSSVSKGKLGLGRHLRYGAASGQDIREGDSRHQGEYDGDSPYRPCNDSVHRGNAGLRDGDADLNEVLCYEKGKLSEREPLCCLDLF